MDRDRSEEFVNPAQAYSTVREEICKLCRFNSENRDDIEAEMEIGMQREVKIEMEIEDRNRDGDKDRHG